MQMQMQNRNVAKLDWECGGYGIDSEKQGQAPSIVQEESETQYFPRKGAL